MHFLCLLTSLGIENTCYFSFEIVYRVFESLQQMIFDSAKEIWIQNDIAEYKSINSVCRCLCKDFNRNWYGIFRSVYLFQ